MRSCIHACEIYAYMFEELLGRTAHPKFELIHTYFSEVIFPNLYLHKYLQ